MNHETKARQHLADRLRQAALDLLDHNIPLTQIVNLAVHDETGIAEDGYARVTDAKRDLADYAQEYATECANVCQPTDEGVSSKIRITATLTLATALDDIEREI